MTRACTATGGPLPTFMWTTLTPHHTSEPLPTVNTGTFFSNALQHALRMRVWVHLVSTSAECFHLLMRKLIAGSALFSGNLGRRLALRLPPLARWFHHICSILDPLLSVQMLLEPQRLVPCRLLRCSRLWPAIRPTRAH